MNVRRFLIWSVVALLTGLGTCNECSSSDNESVLQQDTTYTYRFRSEALAEAVGTTDDHSKIEIECEARLGHQRECFYLLHLRDCALTAAGGRPGAQTPWIDRQPLPDLDKYPVEFSLVNGEIREVNAHNEDPLPYLNIKRGVLSAFVFKMSQMDKVLHESHTDIHGTCPMSSVPDREEDQVKTSKDMLHCHFPSRPDWQFSPWSLFWNMSFIQHVINSTTDCVYKIDGEQRRVEHVACKERHAIMLESTHRTTTAVQTNVQYHLDFVKSEIQPSRTSSPELPRKTGIEYEYDETPVPHSSPSDFLSVAEKMLSDLVADSRDEIRLFTIPQFTDFVAWLRSSHDLGQLLQSVRECAFVRGGLECDTTVKDLANSYLSDALLQCNSLPCAKALTEMARSEELSPTYLDYLYYFWSFMHYSKPGFITNFVDMCKVKNSHQCWMSLGSFTYRTLSRTNNFDEKVREEAKAVAAHYHGRIREDCEVTEDTVKHPTDCLIFMKAASNMGKYYGQFVPTYSAGVRQLLEIATNEHAQTVVRTAALEALGDIGDPDNQGERRAIYNLLLPLFHNESLPASVRLLSFRLLLDSSEEYYFVEHLFKVLKDDAANPEVKYYVAETLNDLMTDLQFGAKREKFINYLRKMLREEGMSLEWILHDTKAKSRSSSHNVFLNLPFLPDSMKRFGLKIKDSFVYDSPVLPTLFRENALFQLFGTFLPASKIGTYIEGFEAMLQLYEKNLRDMHGKPASVSQTFEALTKTLAEFGENVLPEGSLRNFDEAVLSNVQKLRDLYWTHHKKLTPYAKSYLDLFGSTAKYLVYDGKLSPLGGDKLGRFLHSAMQSLAEGVTYNTTRVVRVIEAYHQVPTLMGLPLNWTTNATLAFSLRAGLKYQLNSEDGHAHAKGMFQPSAALTFLNRMVLDFPTITQIGVQANSSAYTSTDFKAQYTSSKGKQTLRFDRPAKTQKVLQLFRTNQLIKHDRYENIPDWDIERVTSSWCTKDGVNSAAGLRFCLSKSYPNVTHRIKPWALMAGSCNWEFLAHPTNQDLVHYGLELHQAMKHKLKEFNAKLSVTEKEKERATRFKVLIDENGKDASVELQTSLMPEFSATLSRNELTWKKNVSGQKIRGALALAKDFKYEFELTLLTAVLVSGVAKGGCGVSSPIRIASEAKVQRAPTKTSSHTEDDSQILVNEEKLTVDTPYSAYVWNKTVLRIGENVKADAYVSYESLKGKSEWMKSILPPSFWENDQKASLKMQLHWKKPVFSEGGSVTRQTHFRLDIPRYVMTLRGDGFESKTRSQINVGLARRDKNRGQLDAFLNFTSDWWTNEDKEALDKDVLVWNITIPRRSWSMLYQKLHEAPKYHHELVFKRALMKPRDQATKSDYVGWWSKDVSDRFTVDEKEVKLTADNEWLTLTNEELVAKYPTLTIQEMEGLRSGVLVSDIVLRYPFRTATESLAYDGYFIYSTGPTTYRFQKDFDLTSSYNNLKLTSHSVYRTGSGGTVLNHASHFTHLVSETKAYNTIHFTSRRPDSKCLHLTFKHDIRSPDFDLTTDAVYRCEKEDQELHTLRLNIDTNSSKWNMLDIKLEQIVEDLSSDYSREEMTTTHATGTIHVDAEWHKHPKHHQKKVVLCSKDGQCPNAELFLEFFGDGRSYVKFSLPNRNDTQVTYKRKMSADHKNLEVKMGYSNNQEGSSDLLEFTGELIAPNYHVWKGMVNANNFAKVRDLVTSGYETFENAFADIAKDEKHPLNEILRPALKVTLYEYWRDLKTQAHRFVSTSWDEVYEIFYTVEAFAEPAYNVLMNTVTSVHEACRSAYQSVKDKSVTIWAIEYFEVPHYFHQGLTNLPHAVGELLNQLALGEENILHFKFITGKIVALTSFLDWPSIEFNPPQLKRLFSYETESRTRFDDWGSVGGHKIALIFGPLHVYTFDGHLYDVPAYPPGADCQYLLAHDVHGSLFSVLSSESALHVLFPEMSLTVNENDEVFVNGSREPSALPLQSSNGKVTVKRSDVVEIWSPSLSVICRSRDFLCILKMSESHAGGIIGLLGNADTHPSNDYELPNGNVSSNLADFLRKYEVSGNPRCQSVAVRATPKPSEEERRECLREFGDACATQYQIREKFVEACASDVQDNNGACFAAAGLAALCHLQHTPTHTSCNAKKPVKAEIGRSVEVVLVVQESKYLTSSDKGTTPAKGIESLIRALDQKFKEDGGYDSVRYALVGFGGNGVHHAPTLHSANKDVWLPADSMIGDVLKTLEFRSREESDAVDALKYSLEELGHDTFHSKVFVVITSKDKQVAEKPVLDYIQKRLDKNGLTLYILSSYPSIEKGKKVFGVRSDGLIFPSQSKEGDEYLDYPRGNLAKLASGTRGSVFLSKFLRDNQPQAFFEEFAQEVWAKVKGEASKCRRCKLVPVGWWWYRQECTIVRC